jgi:carboxypeptidase Q
MKTTFLSAALAACALAVVSGAVPQGGNSPAWLDAYRDTANALVGESLGSARAWDRLAELTDTFGNRLAGSKALERAIEWAVTEMKRDGLEHVRAEKVMVPHWVRGRERAEILSPVAHPMAMLGLGNSVGTPPDGITADVIAVKSFEDLDARGRAAVAGKIVFFNVPWTNYGETVRYRSAGASRAAALGAVGMLLRAVGQPGLRTPHTGSLSYSADAPQIPAAAIALEDADRLQRLIDRHGKVVVTLSMEAKMLPDAESANVIAEIRGREFPDEVVVVSGHFDSWDVGTGAMDDGGGCVTAWEVLRMVKKLGLRPRRTLRAVLFTNEENGLRGGTAYAETHAAELANHVLMIESDGGPFRPFGFGFTGNDTARATVTQIASLLSGIGATRIGPGGGGADIGPAVRAGNIPAMSPDVDGSIYFTLHHTAADTVDKIDPTDMGRHVAAMAVMAYGVADRPTRLGR